MNVSESQEIKFNLINKFSGTSFQYNNEIIANFLFKHLDQYGDKIEHIKKCLNYVFERGGLILLGLNRDDEIIGVIVINETGMGGYIPENILVYIAVHQEMRGQGVGKKMIEEVLKVSTGDIALHVEANNPARFLYEKMGFTNPYLEMRLKR